MNWFRRKKSNDAVDPAQLIRKAEESLRNTRRQQSHVNYLSDWSAHRVGQNGFGDDFEWTLRPKDIPGRT